MCFTIHEKCKTAEKCGNFLQYRTFPSIVQNILNFENYDVKTFLSVAQKTVKRKNTKVVKMFENVF